MSRHAEQLLEFDKLKEIVSGFATCAPGHRAIFSLAPQQDVAALNSEFTLIREAVAYLRPGAEMGFGSLADPEKWLAQLAMPASVLSSADLLDVASLMDTANDVRQTFKGETAKYPRLAERAAAIADFRHLLTAIRRAILPNGKSATMPLHNYDAFAPASRRPVRKSKSPSKAFCVPVASLSVRTTSRCAMIAS